MIPQETVREIMETARIEEVVADFVNLKRSGSSMQGLCPFHDEKTPSFSVSPAKNIFKCFGCGRAGDSVGFVMEHEQFSFVEALRYLAEKYNITVEERQMTPTEVAEMDKADSLYGILNFAANFYQRALLKSQMGQAVGYTYFQSRGLLDKTIEEFQLGFAAEDEDIVGELKKMGYDEELLREAGLINKGGHDFFRNRVIFPIHNLSGKPIALAGRVLGKNSFGPKYLNSPESAIYVKNRVLYGMHLAKTHIRKHDRCYLVEGYTDVISLYQNGIKNVVASSGTSLTTKQVSLIKRFCQHVTLLYDGDKAGIKAAIRGVQMMLQADLNVYIVLFPEGKDPDSYIAEVGHDAFQRFIKENEKDFILFQADLQLQEAKNDPIKRASFVNEMIKTIAFIEDGVKRAVYVQELASLSRMDEQVIIDELNKEIKKKLWDQHKQEKRQKPEQPAPDQAPPVEEASPDLFLKERDIIRILIHGGHVTLPKLADISVRDFILEQLRDFTEFMHPIYDRIYQQVVEQADEPWQPEYFRNHSDMEIRNAIISILADTVEISENWEKKWDIHLQTQPAPEENYYMDALQATLRLKLERVQLMTKENANVLKTAQDEDVIERHIEIQHRLIIMKKELANELRTIVMS